MGKNKEHTDSVYKKRNLLPLFYFPLLLLYEESIFRAFVIGTFPGRTFVITLLLCVSLGSAMTLLCSFWKPKVNKTLSLLLTIVAIAPFVVQTVYMGIFRTPMVLSSMGNAGQAAQFMDIIIHTIIENVPPLTLMVAVPVIARVLLTRFHVVYRHYRLPFLGLFILPVIAGFGIIFLLLYSGGQAAGSSYAIYYHEQPGTLVLNRFGLLCCVKNDLKALVFPDDLQGNLLWTQSSVQDSFSKEPAANADFSNFGENEPDNPSSSEAGESTDSIGEQESEIIETETETEALQIPVPNVMDIDFETLAANETDEVYKAMDEYFAQVEPTYTNEYTGMFKDFNLIFLTAEAFSPYAISEDLTPTLYKLANEGFVFQNFYNPVWGVSTSDGEYVNCLGLIPKSGVWSMSHSSDNWLPFTMGNQFLAQGYTTLAYHNHTYDYYDRDLSHPNLGYTYKGYGNGLDVTYVWPESDLEMMELTIPEYINDDHFSIYYMTVSGHLPYSWGGNAMASKHRDAVESLPYSENVKGYIAANMELDRALEYLIEQLDAAGKLENTVIVMAADHYPYGLEESELNELAGHSVESNFELYESSLILWSGSMEGDAPVIVDKYCSNLDIIPTLSNLFGLEYDSRLLMGRDILSNSPPLVIFSNKSWITDKAMYNSQNGQVTSLSPKETVSDEYVQSIHNEVAAKFTFSTYILDTDYYRYLFSHASSAEDE